MRQCVTNLVWYISPQVDRQGQGGISCLHQIPQLFAALQLQIDQKLVSEFRRKSGCTSFQVLFVRKGHNLRLEALYEVLFHRVGPRPLINNFSYRYMVSLGCHFSKKIQLKF